MGVWEYCVTHNVCTQRHAAGKSYTTTHTFQQ